MQRLSEICLIYFSFLEPKMIESFLITIDKAISVAGKQWPSNVPDFSVLFIMTGDNDCIHMKLNAAQLTGKNLELSYKFVNYVSNTIYIPCLRCPTDSKNDLIILPAETSSKSDLTSQWIKHNSNFYLSFQNEMQKKCDKFVGEYWWKPDARSYRLPMDIESYRVLYLALNKLNCSYCREWGNIGGLLNRDWGAQAFENEKHFIIAGSSIHGFKFPIFVHIKILQSCNDMSFLLESFSRLEWIVTLTATLTNFMHTRFVKN